jgi:processive 1,2-diacylglycerol beta-glucosyltransferase
VVLVTSSVGAGHNQAAAALLASLAAARPGLAVEVIDTMKIAPTLFRLYYAGGYSFMVTRAPWLYGWGYNFLNQAQGPAREWSERLRMLFERTVMRGLIRTVLDRRPVVVVATHFLVLPMLGRLLGQGVEGLKALAVVTDSEAHRWWYGENLDRYFVPTELAAEQVARWGIAPGRITVSGIPIHPKWVAPLDRADILARWKLPADKPIVMLSGGTFFTVGPVEKIARAILDSSDAHVVALGGNNKRLLAALAAFPEAGRRLTPVPFTDRVHELAEVASLIVTKPGGLTTTECQAKGLAMVLTNPTPGQEAANARMLAAAGAAVVAATDDEVIAQVRRLLASPAELQALSAAARKLYRPATQTITEEILKAVE